MAAKCAVTASYVSPFPDPFPDPSNGTILSRGSMNDIRQEKVVIMYGTNPTPIKVVRSE